MQPKFLSLLAMASLCLSITACSEAWQDWWDDHQSGSGSGGSGGSAGAPAPGDRACGARLGDTCAGDEFCNYPPEAICGRADGTGICEAQPQACTREYRPVCGCDGQTYGNACTAHAAGVSVDSEGECPTFDCGGFAGKQCGDGQYCDLAEGQGCKVADASGVCKPRPEVCTDQYDPVCGCDGKTYGNACEAAAAGVTVESEGECPPTFDCGGFAGKQCADGQYCDLAEGQGCKVADASGVCKSRPEFCTQQYDPVCGCDGQTYGNACEAAAAGVTVDSEGECGGAAASCTLGDTEFPAGTGVICADGCNRCACQDNGQWISTLRACTPLPKVELCDPPAESTAGLSITPLYRAEDALALSLNYGGGCFEHTFKLCYSDAFQESSPVQTRLWVADQSEEPDTCLALITRDVVFDLTPLRERYSELYPNGPNEVVLNLDKNKIDYQF